jgi:hypothetical protein
VDFSELLDPDTTPKKYSGFFSLGNIVDSAFAQAIEELEHYTAKTGTSTLDRKLTKSIKPTVTLTMDEPNVPNLRYVFRTDEETVVPGAVAAGPITGETAKLKGTEVRALKQGFNHSSIVVKDFTGVTTYILNTDYEIVDFLLMTGGKTLKGIKRKGAGIGDGDVVQIEYKYDVLAHKLIKPTSNTEIKGMVRLFGVSDTGNEFIYRIDNAQITPNGDFTFNKDDWSTFQLVINVLDNSENAPSSPFGEFEHYGIGTDF